MVEYDYQIVVYSRRNHFQWCFSVLHIPLDTYIFDVAATHLALKSLIIHGVVGMSMKNSMYRIKMNV